MKSRGKIKKRILLGFSKPVSPINTSNTIFEDDELATASRVREFEPKYLKSLRVASQVSPASDNIDSSSIPVVTTHVIDDSPKGLFRKLGKKIRNVFTRKNRIHITDSPNESVYLRPLGKRGGKTRRKSKFRKTKKTY